VLSEEADPTSDPLGAGNKLSLLDGATAPAAHRVSVGAKSTGTSHCITSIFQQATPPRADARGGLEAVMGSKKIKAVVIKGNEPPMFSSMLIKKDLRLPGPGHGRRKIAMKW
jgi:aldehyde:ferredoxin oxidoreductase